MNVSEVICSKIRACLEKGGISSFCVLDKCYEFPRVAPVGFILRGGGLRGLVVRDTFLPLILFSLSAKMNSGAKVGVPLCAHDRREPREFTL